ncbi:hypothetical protein B9Y76_01550 [Stenotrophomonas maltophilia]|uniref:hypothetical protein n=1 Tax=Stenotrophomonas maltophilia TaxID=40324 RepID=UPI000B4E0016|nr:hypothetical protein [Stenotrophomonas maltophilia]MPS42626.1 hypothetical protein [Stenotrophomonas sp.]MBA0385590.1 hypothetical protein [Stenotrophomonas maltophilia]OWQ81611.1 hypothetical protein CEE62_06450 [Stenotrophomonas maltophilia]PJL04697.1 hypothetical protein B9Y76_01550 [Stenotrophomonas maltophilia]QPX93987.1 hypothetical protein HUZ96_14450 [Stenotrophomonas maltophilia]
MKFNSVATVDDDSAAQEMMADKIQDLLEAKPVVITGPRLDPDALVTRMRDQEIDAAIIDYKLTLRGYSEFDGIDFVSKLTLAGIPAVLATSYPYSEKYIWCGRNVPAVIKKGSIGRDLRAAVDSAELRSRGYFSVETKPERTVIRVTSVDYDEVGLVIPAFSSEQFILVSRSKLEHELACDVNDDFRFLAEVNIGAKNSDSIFISNLEKMEFPNDEWIASLFHS